MSGVARVHNVGLGALWASLELPEVFRSLSMLEWLEYKPLSMLELPEFREYTKLDSELLGPRWSCRSSSGL